MIPKIIHYCWFGGAEMSPLALECIISWKKHLPDYIIKEWNEDSFDIASTIFTSQAYAAKKYAYVADYVRLHALYTTGGIYMDTDVELLSSLDPYLQHDAFSGFEDDCMLTTGLMASKKGSAWISDILEYYHDRSFMDEKGMPELVPNPVIVSRIMEQKGIKLNNTFQEIKKYVTYYPSDYFCAKSHETGIVKKTKNTVAIHHFSGSWLHGRERIKRKIIYNIARIFGEGTVVSLKKVFKNLTT